MTTGLILGGLLGAALCALGLSLAPPRPALAVLVGRWEKQRTRRATNATDAQGHQLRLGRWLVVLLEQRGIPLDRARADLELVEVSLEQQLVRKIGYSVVGLLIPSVFTGALVLGGIQPPWTVATVGGIALATAFFWLPDLSVRQQADRRRAELRQALANYLVLVSMSLSGGRGIPEALPSSAGICTGWAYDLLSATIAHARRVGDTPWQAFADLGARTGMRELQDLGGALTLVADDGAKVRTSLASRATTMRRRLLAEAEGAAAKADQSMEMAQVVLFVGFVLFLGFPATVAVITL